MDILRNRKIVVGVATSVSLIIATLFVKYKFMPKIPIMEYKRICKQLAIVDDQIARNELEGNSIDGKEIVFPPKEESIKYRFGLFWGMYKNYNREQLLAERNKLYKRLSSSKKYVDIPKQELELIVE